MAGSGPLVDQVLDKPVGYPGDKNPMNNKPTDLLPLFLDDEFRDLITNEPKLLHFTTACFTFY